MSRPSSSRPGSPPRRAGAERKACGLFLLVVFARPASGGEPRPLLTFVQGVDAHAALARAVRELMARGWRDIDAQSAKRLPDDPSEEPDAYAREAMARAKISGFDMITYGI